MSLTAPDRQALTSIEDELAAADPGLADLLGEFAKLTAGQDMPAEGVALVASHAGIHGACCTVMPTRCALHTSPPH